MCQMCHTTRVESDGPYAALSLSLIFSSLPLSSSPGASCSSSSPMHRWCPLYTLLFMHKAQIPLFICLQNGSNRCIAASPTTQKRNKRAATKWCDVNDKKSQKIFWHSDDGNSDTSKLRCNFSWNEATRYHSGSAPAARAVRTRYGTIQLMLSMGYVPHMLLLEPRDIHKHTNTHTHDHFKTYTYTIAH